MKRFIWYVAIQLLFLLPVPGWFGLHRMAESAVGLGWTDRAWAQEAQHEQQPNQQQDQQQQRPTLGPAPAPSLRGPRTANTVDARKLLRIHNLYVQKIDNSLSDRIIDELTKLGRFHLVSQAKEADATLGGTCMDLRRLKRVHSEIFINDRAGNSVWQDTVYRPFNPPTLSKAVDETAEVVVDHLSDSIREAQKK